MDHSPYIRQTPGNTCAVLMIHGIVGTPRHFDCLIPHVPEQWDIYDILLDGHGGTIGDFCRTSMRKWKAQTHTALEDLCSRYEQIVVIAHSMGTLLTIEAVDFFPKVTALILLNVPLCPRVHPALIPRLLRLCFGKIDPDNIWEVSLQKAAGVPVSKKLWLYLGFIPRYLELFSLCRKIRAAVSGIALPCYSYFSSHDELVSMRSSRWFLAHPTAHCRILEHSGHFSYSPEDLPAILSAMEQVLHTPIRKGTPI